jgi:hypothetical protein
VKAQHGINYAAPDIDPPQRQLSAWGCKACGAGLAVGGVIFFVFDQAISRSGIFPSQPEDVSPRMRFFFDLAMAGALLLFGALFFLVGSRFAAAEKQARDRYDQTQSRSE